MWNIERREWKIAAEYKQRFLLITNIQIIKVDVVVAAGYEYLRTDCVGCMDQIIKKKKKNGWNHFRIRS